MLIKSKKERKEEARRRAIEKERESRRKKTLRTKYGQKTGIKGFKEREKNYITCKVGAISNGAALIGLVAMFIRGLI